jgi:hypothetical protein
METMTYQNGPHWYETGENQYKIKFKIGDKICKPKGYTFNGTVVSVFTTLNGEIRVVAELTTENGLGMLHIFSESQLELRKQ